MRRSELPASPHFRRRLARLWRTSVFRLAVLFALAFSLVVAISLAIVYWLSSQYILGQMDASLQAEIQRLQTDTDEADADGLAGQIAEHLRHAGKQGRLYLLTDAAQRIRAGNLLAWPPGLVCGEAIEFSDQSPILPPALRADDADVQARILSTPLKSGGCLLVGQALVEEEGFTDHTGYLLSWAVGIITLLSLLGGGWMGLAVLRRIDVITDTARQIMAGEFSRRIPDTGHGDEFSELSARLNQMLNRIDELMAGMRSVTDHIAHDLRSPLTRLRNRLEISLTQNRPSEEYREAMRQALDDADQLLGLFNTLIAIAQAEAGVRREHFAPVDLSVLLADLVELYQWAAEDRGLHLTARIEPGVQRLASRGLLTQAIVNLLENALHHLPAGSRVEIGLSRTAEQITLTVSDNGPGIPDAADRLRVLERFVRLDAARSTPGSGLGLSLVRAAMHEHGGQVTLEDNHPGLKVVLILPTDSG
ncbi:ATP-binding protein [Halothiobacillus sp. DCM-1]|uniref:sensor histidine kinase n=1 Tax=Halothiobacillus sp. DCM-1 TaxID=3112558 RepID=UPI00324C03D7